LLFAVASHEPAAHEVPLLRAPHPRAPLPRAMRCSSNFVPWKLLEASRGIVVKYAQLDKDECLDVAHLESLLSERTKLVAINHVSNTLGCVNDVKAVAAAAHAVGAKVLVDACQSVPHMRVDVQEMGCDWLVASGHKMCGPTGIGFLWGRYDLLDEMVSSPPHLPTSPPRTRRTAPTVGEIRSPRRDDELPSSTSPPRTRRTAPTARLRGG
jgi:selenocysteine lyase/cysteine desulfurase